MNARYNEIDQRFNTLIEKAKRQINFESGINKSKDNLYNFKEIYIGDTGKNYHKSKNNNVKVLNKHTQPKM